jgi:hypothetical protein
MAFEYTEHNREEYFDAGFTVLRDLIPPSLLTDLRIETDKARDLARKLHGPRAQRLQPIYNYPELDYHPFHDFSALPELQRTVNEVLGDSHRESNIMGVLLEPAAECWCTHWHRDWGYNAPHVKLEPFFAAARDLQMFNQLNAALYDDHSLWVVPYSHNREDSSAEREVFPKVPPPGPELISSMSPAEREGACLAYTRKMSGATPVQLFAGDVAFYRACQWHIGNYVPYAKRATLHDAFYGPGDLKWQEMVREWQAEARRRDGETG